MNGAHSTRCGLVLLGLFAALPSTICAQTAPRNLGFELGRDKPSHWFAGGEGYLGSRVDTDPHEGAYCLRLTYVEPGRFGVATQCFKVQAYRGQQVRFTGYVRTEDVRQGHAGLWLRVDEGTQRGFLDNMSDRGVTGTQDWKRYEISTVIGPEATQICFGAILTGEGTAWYDGFSVEIDGESLEIPPLERPARPDYGRELLSDAALRTPEDPEAPEENAAWSRWVAENAMPIRSLVAPEYTDLAPLSEYIGKRRIVQLGESSHGVAEFNLAKVRLIRYLHEELGFDVLAFESSIFECHTAGRHVGQATPETVMKESIFGVWHTEEVLELFDYIEHTHQTDRPLILCGFDTQISSDRGVATRPAFFRDVIARVDPEYADVVYTGDQSFLDVRERGWEQMKRHIVTHLDSLVGFYDDVADFLQRNRDALVAAHQDDAKAPWIAWRTALSMPAYFGQLTKQWPASTSIRDRGMADNFSSLFEEIYPGSKFIVWAHNYHIRHANEATGGSAVRTMGGWLHERYPDDLYTVGLYMYQGIATMNDRSLYEIEPAITRSLASILYRTRLRYCFVDFLGQQNAPGTAWMFETIVAKSWGTQPLHVTLRDQYDGIVFIHSVTPPIYR